MSEKLRATHADLRQLVEAEWWEWMPGMLMQAENRSYPLRITEILPCEGGPQLVVDTDSPFALHASSCLPIPSDPATAGCLLEMYLRRAYRSPTGRPVQGRPDLCLMGLSARWPGPDAYASFGDFMVAVLLEGDDA